MKYLHVRRVINSFLPKINLVQSLNILKHKQFYNLNPPLEKKLRFFSLFFVFYRVLLLEHKFLVCVPDGLLDSDKEKINQLKKLNIFKYKKRRILEVIYK